MAICISCKLCYDLISLSVVACVPSKLTSQLQPSVSDHTMLSTAANCRRGGALLCGRLYSSALNGNRSPLENVYKSSNPMLHQEDSTSRSTEDAFEMRVPGVVGIGAEPNVPRLGTVDWPNPSEQLLEKVPIAKVTVDGVVTAQSMPKAPGESMPRN